MSTSHDSKYGPLAGPDALRVERLLLGQLSADEQRALVARYGAEAIESVKERLTAENASLLAQLPAEAVVPRIRRRAEAVRAEAMGKGPDILSWRRLAWAVPVAAAAAVLLAVAMGVFDGTAPGGPFVDDGTRIKGLEPALHLYLGEPGQAEATPLEDGAVVHPGDVVQVGFLSGGHPYGVIVSIDGAGAVTLHSPEEPSAAGRLEGTGELLLAHGFRLDAAPRFERFFLVTADSPISAAAVVDSARRLAADPETALEGSLELPDDWQQTTFTLRKEPQ